MIFRSIFVLTIVGTLFTRQCTAKSTGIFEREIDCFSQNKIYHPESDKCYKLLTRGPCESGYWFVLKKPNSARNEQITGISAVCVKENCPQGGYYWKKTNTCVQPKDKMKLCGDSVDEELLNNVFGEAECVCARDPVRARLNGDKRNKCYQLLSQGPCRRGQVLGFAPQNKNKATCVEDRCYEEKVRRNVSHRGIYSALAPWTNGSCYELGTQGPCLETQKFKVHQVTFRTDCIALTNAIFDREKPQNCYQDENGDCQKKINKTQNANRYKEELLGALGAARKKRT